ncbi:sulfatase-like hydrolase/transferase [Avibacterium paragallinarum]|uniref:sulfatase-like hydrolase/transferase n=1 Tax=Avibacterium paragallinarum TaxID=728 RepID=UPI001A93618F|nr:sulfatase-like hydrolase/transferase [Avibacterium paragallinarum]
MSITRRKFIRNVALGSAGMVVMPETMAKDTCSNEGEKLLNAKNIVIITADQLAKRAVGGYGNKVVKTPNIDALMAQGVSFENAYCSYPLCAPSRSSFWTGCLPHHTGVVANDNAIFLKHWQP